jgi:uncharacterized protein YcgI (DUF1989 family)
MARSPQPQDEQTITVPGGQGRAVQVARGNRVHIVNTGGRQVVDTWALSLPDGRHHMSMSHSRPAMGRINPRAGDSLVDDNRQPILDLVHDTSTGRHDTLLAACDAARYAGLGHRGWHASCSDNFKKAVLGSGLFRLDAPDPLNLFQAVNVAADGSFTLASSTAAPGSRVVFETRQDLLLVVSACPMDLIAISGAESPRSIDVLVQRQ